MIVEDRVALEGRPLETKLRRAGYDVVGIAETAAQAIKMALSHKPSVVLMDIGLGPDDMGGVRAARKILESYDTQIIYLTGMRVEQDLLDEVGETKNCQFLLKPVRENQLLSSVRLAVMKARGNKVVFLCYSREDRRWADEWLRHMVPMREVGIDVWEDSKIGLGKRFKIEIEKALGSSSAAVCLVSHDFLRSKFIMSFELPRLLQAADKDDKPIIPIFVGGADETKLKKTGLLEFHAVNKPEDPIDRWTKNRRERECWGHLCKRLKIEMK